MTNRRKGPEPLYKRVIVAVVAIVIIITSGLVAGSISNISIDGVKSDSVHELYSIPFLPPVVYNRGGTAQPVATRPADTAPATTILSPVNTTVPAAPDTTTPASEATTAPASQQGEATTAPTEAPAGTSSGALSSSSSVEEIVAYFNTSANKIKTDATKVVRNYEDLQNDEEYMQVPSAVSSIAKTAMNAFLKKNETPVEYASQADIVANYPVKAQPWVSQVTADQLESATCEDDGTNYNITLTFKDDLETVNPAFGQGYGKAFNILQESEIVLDNPLVSISNVKLTYHDGVIKCTVDKATGNMTASNYSMPVILSLSANVKITTVDAQIGMIFNHDYTITY